uniref:Uncharacterized protein n=1 Tax=Anguilla anguilla TaxID=7936 RepID=A0A0E9QU05_ANGAN
MRWTRRIGYFRRGKTLKCIRNIFSYSITYLIVRYKVATDNIFIMISMYKNIYCHLF